MGILAHFDYRVGVITHVAALCHCRLCGKYTRPFFSHYKVGVQLSPASLPIIVEPATGITECSLMTLFSVAEA